MGRAKLLNMAQATFLDQSTCVNNASSGFGPNTLAPIGFTKSEIFALYYNIKSFNVVYQASWNWGFPPDSINDGYSNVGAGSGSFFVKSTATKEPDLCCVGLNFSGSGGTNSGQATDIDENGAGEPDADLPTVVTPYNTSPAVSIYITPGVSNSGLYYPYIGIGGYQQNLFGSEGSNPPANNVNFSGNCTITSSYFSKTIRLYSRLTSSVSSFYGTQSVNLTITANEYWTYS